MSDAHVLRHAPTARDLITAVHNRDDHRVWEHLAHADTHTLHALILLLADAADTATAQRLDRLVRDEHGRPVIPEAWTDDELRRAHAAFNRRERDPWTEAGEREYQRRRSVRRRRIAAMGRVA